MKVVLSDSKVITDGDASNSITSADLFTPEVLNYQDYYPFGQALPSRLFQASGGYRYGFNGKEKTDEVSGSGVSYDYGFRIYDARVARFLSVDPLSIDYALYTPYQFAGNTPIWAIDLDGREEYFVTEEQSGNKFVRTYTKNDLSKLSPEEQNRQCGKIQFKIDGKPSGKMFDMTDENKADVNLISENGGYQPWGTGHIKSPTTLIKKVDGVTIQNKKAKAMSEEKVKDKIQTPKPQLSKTEEKKYPVVEFEPLYKVCDYCVQGSSDEHYENSINYLKEIFDGGDLTLIITMNGGGNKDETWSSPTNNGSTRIQDVIRQFNRIKSDLVKTSGGKIKEDQIQFKLGEANKEGATYETTKYEPE